MNKVDSKYGAAAPNTVMAGEWLRNFAGDLAEADTHRN